MNLPRQSRGVGCDDLVRVDLAFPRVRIIPMETRIGNGGKLEAFNQFTGEWVDAPTTKPMDGQGREIQIHESVLNYAQSSPLEVEIVKSQCGEGWEIRAPELLKSSVVHQVSERLKNTQLPTGSETKSEQTCHANQDSSISYERESQEAARSLDDDVNKVSVLTLTLFSHNKLWANQIRPQFSVDLPG